MVEYFDRKGVTDVTIGLQRKLQELMEYANDNDESDELLQITKEEEAMMRNVSTHEMEHRHYVDSTSFATTEPISSHISEVAPGNTILAPQTFEMILDDDMPVVNTTANTLPCVYESDVCPTDDVLYVEWDDIDQGYNDDDGNCYKTLEDARVRSGLTVITRNSKRMTKMHHYFKKSTKSSSMAFKFC